jgi:hypothetical protein
MAVGTIPILMHTDWFHPRLVHGENCFRIDHADSLSGLLQHVLAMPPEEVRAMSARVIEYYDAHLSPAGFLARLHSHASNDLDVFFNFERQSQLERVTPESVAVRCS